MLNRIKEIDKALEANMPEAALALTLTLPDICGQIEYPNEKSVGVRYKKWLDNNLDFFMLNEGNNINGHKVVSMTSEAIYKLRCRILHSGDADLSEDITDLDYFVLKAIGSDDFTDEQGFGVQCGASSFIDIDGLNNEVKTYSVDVKILCNTIKDATMKYYNGYVDKSKFDKHRVTIVEK